MHTTLKSLALLALTATVASAQSAAAADAVVVDAKLPDYAVTSGVSGNLNAVGSDTLINLMTFWGEGFKARYPNVNAQVEGKGSSTAPVALSTGAANVGPMSREMRSSEVASFAGKFGYKPTKIAVAIDALAVFVHKDNPVKGLSLSQIDGIFSSTRKRGGQDINTWGDAKMTGAFASKTISSFGRNSASGTYGFFKELSLKNGDYKSSIKEQPGSSAVVQGVAAGRRVTLLAEGVADEAIRGTSPALGPGRIEIKAMDRLLMGRAIEDEADELPYRQWKLRTAPEPRALRESAAGE